MSSREGGGSDEGEWEEVRARPSRASRPTGGTAPRGGRGSGYVNARPPREDRNGGGSRREWSGNGNARPARQNGNGVGGGRGNGNGNDDYGFHRLEIDPNKPLVVNIVSNKRVGPKEVTSDKLAAANMGWGKGTLTPPPSKGVGTKSVNQVNIIVNHLESNINLPSDCHYIYQYNVEIDLDEQSKKRRMEQKDKSKCNGKKQSANPPGPECYEIKDPPRPALWKDILLHAVIKIEKRGVTFLATDGKKSLYTTRQISFIPSEEKVDISIKLKELSEDETSDDGYNVTVSEVATIEPQKFVRSLNNRKEFLDEGNKLPEGYENLDRVYNIALKTPALHRHASDGNGSFFPTPKDDGFPLGGGIVNWTGYSLTYTIGWKPFVTVDVANAPFILGKNVLTVLKDLFDGREQTDILKWKDRDFEKATNLLRSCRVSYTQAHNGKKMSQRVTGISRNVARNCTFDMGNNRITNVDDYFKSVKKMPLKYKNGPCLELGSNSIVPAEFCTVEKGQLFKQKLSDAQSKRMIKDTAKPPEQRLNHIRDTIKESNFNSQKVLNEFGMSVSNQLLLLSKTRVLPPPSLIYGKDKGQASLTPRGTSEWDMAKEGLQFLRPFNGGNLVYWAVLNLAKNICRQDDVFKFAKDFVRNARYGGLILEDVDIVMKSHYKELTFPKTSPSPASLIQYFKDQKTAKRHFVLVILPSNDAGNYGTIKQSSELEYYSTAGLLTQCVVANNVNKAQPATVDNILKKLNVKLGGLNNLLSIDDPELSNIDLLKVPVMIMGADVTHPGAETKFPSLAAVTASCDRTAMPFHMHSQAQQVAGIGAAEIITRMDLITKNMIGKFIETTGHRPWKIIVYRDGVGDSQFDEVLNSEMLKIREGCTDASNDTEMMLKAVNDRKLGIKRHPYEPKITFIAVQKRHKTRFFPENPRKDGVGKAFNAPPGTIVDTQIVNPGNTDFYLLSHLGIQGTSRPTRYQVLWDDSDFSINEIEILTYYLCYCYCRCDRPVGYPSATYYAHLSCKRAKIYTNSMSAIDSTDINKVNERLVRQHDLLKLHPMHFV